MKRPPPVAVIPASPGGAVLSATLLDLMQASTETAFAVTHIRLRALETVVSLLPGMQACRLVVGGFNAAGLAVPGAPDPARRGCVEQLLLHASSGRFEFRSAGAGRWNPDFSLYRLEGGGHFSVCMFGAHYLLPLDEVEWPLTCVLTRRAAVQEAHRHFEALWASAHDVRPALLSMLEQQLCG